MATTFLYSIALFLLLILHTQAQSPTGPPGPIDLTKILDKNGQFTIFIRLLTLTQVATQVNNHLNSSTEGLTIFAPTDKAFNKLKPGTLNGLSDQEQVQLVLYHVLPKYYTLSNLLLVSNPVRTQATGQDGGAFGLNFTRQGNQVNVSSGIVDSQINNALRKDFPLAVYQVDKVLLPEELFGVNASPEAPSTPVKKAPDGSKNTTSGVKAPPPAPSVLAKNSPDRSENNNTGVKALSPAPSFPATTTGAEAPSSPAKNSLDGSINTTTVAASQPSSRDGSSGTRIKSLGFVIVGLICMGVLS